MRTRPLMSSRNSADAAAAMWGGDLALARRIWICTPRARLYLRPAAAMRRRGREVVSRISPAAPGHDVLTAVRWFASHHRRYCHRQPASAQPVSNPNPRAFDAYEGEATTRVNEEGRDGGASASVKGERRLRPTRRRLR
ncbi:hypothetical protein PR202_ga12566 [Eleusine coracana subsp. coracana]|uniref:Uncharacterized protein n=1 Tax=Eleusine coracana subsp. coracana TaxID=191504 RepID=A0AAV5CCJ0_ELECO|nr:hypothetical protein PR202_ga12566 [Eleusine coracana subsp. coracana]